MQVELLRLPKDGVVADDPEGIYWFENNKRQIQVICIGTMPLSPRDIADELELVVKRALRVVKVGALAPAPANRQMSLDRAFIDIWIE